MTDTAIAPVEVPREVLRKQATFQDVIDTGAAISHVGDYLGDGFSVADKATLIGTPFLILDWRFNEDESSQRGFVSVSIMTKHNEKFVVNDGGTGIMAQMQEIQDAGVQPPLLVAKGLRRSDYTVEGVGDATTFYLDSSK